MVLLQVQAHIEIFWVFLVEKFLTNKNKDGSGQTADGQYDIVVFDPMRKPEAEAKLKELLKSADKPAKKEAETKATKKDPETKSAPKKRKSPSKSK